MKCAYYSVKRNHTVTGSGPSDDRSSMPSLQSVWRQFL